MMNVIPFKYPDEHTYYTNIGCGLHQYQVTLTKCTGPNENCEELITGGVQSTFIADHCVNESSNDNVKESSEEDKIQMVTEKILVIEDDKQTVTI